MMSRPLPAALPADLPMNWQMNDTVSPQGTDVGLTKQHGYNYLMEQVNKVQEAANTINAAFDHVAKNKHRILTLAATGWSDGYPYSQTVTAEGVTPDDDIRVAGVYIPDGATIDQVKAWNKAAGFLMYSPDGVADGKVTFKAYKKPEVDFQVITEGA